MKRRLARLWSRHKLLVLLFAAAFALDLALGLRIITHAVYWADPAHREQPLAGWMTPRYVVKTYGAPPEAVARALDLPRTGIGRKITLEDLAEDRGVPVSVLIDALVPLIGTAP